MATRRPAATSLATGQNVTGWSYESGYLHAEVDDRTHLSQLHGIMTSMEFPPKPTGHEPRPGRRYCMAAAAQRYGLADAPAVEVALRQPPREVGPQVRLSDAVLFVALSTHMGDPDSDRNVEATLSDDEWIELAGFVDALDRAMEISHARSADRHWRRPDRHVVLGARRACRQLVAQALQEVALHLGAFAEPPERPWTPARAIAPGSVLPTCQRAVPSLTAAPAAPPLALAG